MTSTIEHLESLLSKLESKEISENAWNENPSRFSEEEFERACAGKRGKSETLNDYFLPHHEPDGALSREGVLQAAVKFSQVRGASPESLLEAKVHLAQHFRELDLEVPEQLMASAADPNVIVASGFRIVREAPEKRMTLAVAYPAYENDAKEDSDSYGTYMTADDLEKTAWDYMKTSRRVGLMHEGQELWGDLVESYIWRWDSIQMNDESVNTGDWLMGIQWDEPAWELIKEGFLKGLSIQGKVENPDG